jgi:acyl carrier protein
MNRDEIFEKVKSIVAVFCKNQANLDNATDATRFLDDLDINSARLVDIILDMEDGFHVEIDDESADKIVTMGDAVNLILALQNKTNASDGI